MAKGEVKIEEVEGTRSSNSGNEELRLKGSNEERKGISNLRFGGWGEKWKMVSYRYCTSGAFLFSKRKAEERNKKVGTSEF